MLEHSLKVLLFPDHPSSKHWCQEMQSWVGEALKLTRNLPVNVRRRLLTDYTLAFFDEPMADALAAEIAEIEGYLLPSWIKSARDVIPIADVLLPTLPAMLQDCLDLSLDGRLRELTPEFFKKHRPDLSSFRL